MLDAHFLADGEIEFPVHQLFTQVNRKLRIAGDLRQRPCAEAFVGDRIPVGHPEPLRTLVDTRLERYDEVWAAAGHPHAVFPTTYAELLRLTGGTAADVGVDPVG